jgi:hypothetical protein
MKSSRTKQQRMAFLAALGQGYSVTFAGNEAGLARAALIAWRAEDDDFAQAWDAAVEAGTDLLEDLARDRVATGGDSLLMFLLKSRRPDKYRERHDHQVDAGVASGVLIAPAAIDLETWSRQAANQAQRQRDNGARQALPSGQAMPKIRRKGEGEANQATAASPVVRTR